MYHRTTGRTVEVGNATYLYFAGTSYLGLHVDSQWADLVQEGCARYGLHYGGSRLFHYVPDIYTEVEAFFCELMKGESALLCSSGTVAGQLLRLQATPLDRIYYMEAHPSVRVYESNRRVGHVSTPEELVRELSSLPSTGKIWIFTSSIYPTGGYIRQWEWLYQLPSDLPIHLVVDDSHGVGVLGRCGEGISTFIPPPPPQVELTLLFSLGKAYATPGAIIVGASALIDNLRHHPLWGGASPPPPGPLNALMRGGRIIALARERLQQHIVEAEALSAKSPVIHLPGFPVFVYEMEGLSPYLEKQSILLSSFHYPTPDAPLISRIVLNACHEAVDVQRVFGGICDFLKYL